MNDSTLYYSVGALLYCPANNPGIADSIVSNKFGNKFSLALCLEDTISDKFVNEAEEILYSSLSKIYSMLDKKEFYLPKIFIRIRTPQQMLHLYKILSPFREIISGFILPKFSLANVKDYVNASIEINSSSDKRIYIMPIYENAELTDLRKRYDSLYTLKDCIEEIKECVLNIRVGGNDLCNVYGFRRSSIQTIHSIKPISNILSDIISVYSRDYVVSGPVWEYFDGDNWEQGMLNELAEDRLCGFVGKTVIHPKQIDLVNKAYSVSLKDLSAAKQILSWDEANASLVSKDCAGERMNEKNVHENWARKILFLSEVYGTEG
jgi:ATP/GTP-binding protein